MSRERAEGEEGGRERREKPILHHPKKGSEEFRGALELRFEKP